MEIIEFPSILIDVTTYETVAEIQFFVRPVERPQINAFCTKLTGITQSQLDGQPAFPEALERYLAFLKKHKVERPLFVTCGDWEPSSATRISPQKTMASTTLKSWQRSTTRRDSPWQRSSARRRCLARQEPT